ncbi:hypothetical protein EVAR_9236_1 [Eumeta japonica]|uniref:Uncharacterized protein n=1 Tax=Eumeta variegata TaxID=151549 RepID=A0A4C2AFA2_EUMVA|nr:hypothetical protein EVAR_9236_1 [Eumeta japonica]
MGGNSSGKSGVLLAAGAWIPMPHRTGRGIVHGKNTDHVSLRFIQSNLQRSKLATSGCCSLGADRRKNCGSPWSRNPMLGILAGRVPRMQSRPKTAPRRGPVKAAIIVLDSGVDRGGSDPHRRKRHSCRDCEHDDARGVDLCDFFDTEGCVLNEGQYAFEVYRGTVSSRIGGCDCGSALLDRVEEWQVVQM